MADFGWAFVKSNLLTGSAPPAGAVQYNDGNNKLAASSDFMFLSASTSQLNLTGTLNVSGAINANEYNVTVTNKNVINLTSTGPTKFGDTSDDIHQFTGSVLVIGELSSSLNVSASGFYGDGSNLTGITLDRVTDLGSTTTNAITIGGLTSNGNLTVTGAVNVSGHLSSSANISASAFYGDGSNLTKLAKGSNTQVQFNNSGELAGSSNLTFDGSSLDVAGHVSASLGISASAFHGDGSNLTKLAEGSNTQVQFNNSGELAGSSNLTFTGTNLNILGNASASINISASAFYGDGSNLTGIATTLDAVTNNGNTTSNAMTASALNLTGLAAGQATNTKFLALDASNNVVLTSSSGGGGGNIGEAEDSSYTDGLFSDFVSSTPIGTAIDRFNEILKIIVPGPAPAVDRINYTNPAGIGTKITFDEQEDAPSGYTVVGTTGSFSSNLEVNDQYTVATSGEDFRLGVYNGTQEITGVINFHVAEELKTSEVNYSHNAFGNAESGSLKLIVNGAILQTLNLTASGTGNPNTGSAVLTGSDGSGFFAVSTTASAKDQNGSLYSIFQHRTAKYVIDPDDQRKGWNIAKIEHQHGSTNYVTNFVQWFNDTDASSQGMSVSNNRVTFTGNSSKYLSGVQYFRSASLVYNADVANVYKFTYPTGNVVTFNRTSNVDAISAQSLPATDGTDKFNKILKLTASTDTNDDTMLNDSTTLSIDLDHPLKTTLSTAGAVTTSGILIYNVDTANSNLVENFDLEDFRITNQNYEDQVDVTGGGATWSSQNHMTSSGATGHTDGLIMYNGALRSPKQGANGGNFSTLANGPTNNPNYSGITGTRKFFRKIQNTSGSPVRDLKITSTKSSKINNSSLIADNVQFFVKVPESTAWLNISQNFVYGDVLVDGRGTLINGASDNSNTGTSDSGNSVHCITFGTASIPINGYAVIRIDADELWTGNFDTLQFQLGASDVSAPIESQALDDIDLDDGAGETARLSFGTSNIVDGYTNVAGGVGSLSAINSNTASVDNGDTNRGVFKVAEVMGGTLNEDVAASGSNYTANSFKNAYTGSLLLIVNDATASTLSLANLDANNNLSSDTGFSVGAVGFSTTTDNIPDYTKPYRTGTYSIGTSLQRSGWNYARVIHRIGLADTLTNYVQWVVDPSGSNDNTSAGLASISNFGHSNAYYQSGIGYFASNPTGSFIFIGTNFYSNVCSNDAAAISFPTTTNCQITNIRAAGPGITTFDSAVSSCAMPNLNNTDDCEAKTISITGSVQYNGSSISISGGLGQFSTPESVEVNGRILHPLKSNKATARKSKSGFMRYSGSLGSTTQQTNEYFGLETYRIISGNYTTQDSLTHSDNKWNSATAMNNGGAHDDGMVTANGFLISPKQIGNAGDTRNVDDGGSLQAPSGNPDYSSLTTSTRTFYRYFDNNTSNDRSSITITLYGSGSLVKKATSLGNNGNFYVEAKIPGKTGWLDVGTAYDSNNPLIDGAGALDGAAPGNPAVNISTDGVSVVCNFNGESLLGTGTGPDFFALKISADEDWLGYLSRIQVAYS